MVKLDRRLAAIMSEIPQGASIVDIGTDHGKIPVRAILNGIVEKAIATDISRKSLDKARKLSDTYEINSRIEFRQGNGLEVIQSNECETLIIAGMGAREIISILMKNEIIFDTYIFAPHQETVILREYLMNNGFFLKSDYKVKSSRKFYDIIVAIRGNEKLSNKELYLGKSDKDSIDYIEFLKFELDRLDRLLSRIPIEDKKSMEISKRYDIVSKEYYDTN